MGVNALIAVTPGEPAGIGPDLVVQYAQQPHTGATPWVAVADADMLRERARIRGGAGLARGGYRRDAQWRETARGADLARISGECMKSDSS